MKKKLAFLVIFAILMMVPCVSGNTGKQAQGGALNGTIPEGFTPQSGIPLKEPPEEALIVPPMPQPTPHWQIWLILVLAIIGINTFVFIRLKRKKAGLLMGLLLLFILPSFPTVLAYDFGTPLDTSDCAFFAYYNETSNWVLADTVTGWQEYTDNGNYYDGRVRVWQDVRDSEFDGNDGSEYVDVYCRVRADGWILAWHNVTDNEMQHYVFFGRERSATSPLYPVENSTTLSRAIERIYVASGKTFVGYDEINYYDYQFTSTKYLSISGRAWSTGSDPRTEEWYFIIPDGYTCEQAWSFIGGSADYSTMYMRIYFDGVIQWQVSGQSGEHGWHGQNVTDDCTVAEKHTVKLNADGNQYSRVCGGIIIWIGDA